MIILEKGDKKVVHVKCGSHSFTVKLVDIVNELVDIHKCVSNVCKHIVHDATDYSGVIEFKDEINGVSTVKYLFKVKNKVFAELNIIPVIIDVNEILEKTTSLLETLITAKRVI